MCKNGNKKLRIKKSLLKNPTNVALAIKQAGFYDGNIYKLAGIDYKTGHLIDEKIKKPKKVENEEIELTDDLISQLKKLKKLLDEGIITEEEFSKLKKKILN